MVNSKFVLSGIIGGICYFLLGWLFYGFLLRSYFEANGGTAIGVNREMPILWILFIGHLSLAFLVATIFSWRKIFTPSAGAKSGAIIGFLSGLGTNFIMYATSNIINKMTVMANVSTTTVMTLITGTVIAIILGKGKQQAWVLFLLYERRCLVPSPFLA